MDGFGRLFHAEDIPMNDEPHADSKWTHNICGGCWNKRFPDRPFDWRNYGSSDLDTCCYCDTSNQDGLYYREDPVTVHGGKGD